MALLEKMEKLLVVWMKDLLQKKIIKEKALRIYDCRN